MSTCVNRTVKNNVIKASIDQGMDVQIRMQSVPEGDVDGGFDRQGVQLRDPFLLQDVRVLYV